VTKKTRTWILAALMAASLTSCQESFDIRVFNRSRMELTAHSNDQTSAIQPGQSAVLQFPSKENGSTLHITSNRQHYCYALDFDLDRNGERLIAKHHVLQSYLDASLSLHLPAAQTGGKEEVVRANSC